MPILDKDGKIYRIPSPNPIMKNQEFWDQSKLIIFNLPKKKTKTIEIQVPIMVKPKIEYPIPLEDPIPLEEPIRPQEEFPNEDIQEEIEEIEEVKETPPEPKIVESIPVPSIQSTDRRLSKLTCLPYVSDTYQSKFTFEAFVLDDTTLQYMFWTNIVIQPKSIIYYDKKWWKIYEQHPKRNGYIYVCNVSDVQPDLT